MNYIPGSKALIEKAPELTTPRGAMRAAVAVLGTFGVALVVLTYAEGISLPLAFVLQLLLYVINYWLVQQVIRGPGQRRPYADILFNRFLPATGLNLAAMAYVLLTSGWVLSPAPLPEESIRLVWLPLGILVGLYLGLTGLLLLGRAVQAAGVDTLALVYSYHPDEGTRLTGGLYDLVRHPAYAGIDRIVLALGFFNGTAYALLLAVIFVFVWHRTWIWLEEDELLARFGDDYRAYREAVPALSPTSIQGELALLEATTRRAQSVPAEPAP